MYRHYFKLYLRKTTMSFNFTHADTIDSKFYSVGDATETLITELLMYS